MALDPERVAEVREWLSRALADLESATILIDASHHDTAVFHVQQAAEGMEGLPCLARCSVSSDT